MLNRAHPMTAQVTALILAAFTLHACGGEPARPTATPPEDGTDGGASQPAATNPLGFEVWHADFPGAPDHPHLSPRQPGLWYDRTPRQAVEMIAARLQGNCTRDAWLMAPDFFSRVDPEDLDSLITGLDRALQAPNQSDLAENMVEAVGRSRSPRGGPALVRALEHPRLAIRNKAMQALIGAGSPDVVRQAASMFGAVDGRGIEGWIKAAVEHLPPEEAALDFRELLLRADVRLVRDVLVVNALQLPVPHALAVFEPLIGQEPEDLITTIAGLRHAAGDPGGTSMVVDLLRRPEPQARLGAVQALRLGGAAELLDRILPLTTDPDPSIRMAVVELIAGIDGEQVDLSLEAMTADEAVDVRRAALAALVRRGRRQALDELLETVRTGTGTRVILAVQDLVAARDGGSIPTLVARMDASPADERLDYLRAIALTTTREAFAPLRDVFLADDAFARRNRPLVAYLMANCRGAETEMLELFRVLPSGDYQRRALLIGTLSNVAADRESAEIAGPIYAEFRRIVADREELPQIRLSALERLRRDLRLEDMKTVKRLAPDEKPPMRKALTDFLFEFF